MAVDDWETWRDTLVFREELRAIGESLIETRGNVRTVMGCGKYCEQLENASPNVVQRWSSVVLNFFLDLEGGSKDFRRIRLERMLVHLVRLIRLLNDWALETDLRDACSKLEPAVDEE